MSRMELIYKEVFKDHNPKCLLFQTNKPILSEITNRMKMNNKKQSIYTMYEKVLEQMVI